MKKTLTIGGWSPHAVKKALLIMKLSFLLLLAGTLQVSANVNGQSTFTLNLKQIEISRLLTTIEREGTYHFLYNSRLKDIHDKISIDVSNSPIREVLNKAFNGTELTYKLLENNLIVIISASLAFQDISVTGKITGDNGEPLSNVTVYVKGTSRGTTTDNNGNYTITVPEKGTLVVSYIGFDSKEIAVNSQSVINVKLSQSAKQMEQVVVVGYGTQRKIDVTGSIAQVKGDEIAKQASTNAMSALQGKVAGVQITNNGTPGTAPLIRIRGLGTYYANANPLYIVDGVWYPNDVNFLNPADIESVNILKDASSEAIYGINGANGVIIITTKKGSRNGKSNVTYNGSVGYQKATNLVKMANAHEYAILFNELGRANGATTFLDSSQFGTGTNWFDQALRNALVTNHQIGVSGGSEKSSYNFSVGYLGQQGILKTNNYKRYTIHFQNDFQISRFVKAGYSALGSYATSNDPPAGIWHALYSAAPVVPVKFADGTYGDPGYYGLGTAVSNPQVSMDYNTARSRTYDVTGSAYIDIKFLSHFTLHSSAGGDYKEYDTKNYIPVYKATNTQQNSVSNLNIINHLTRSWIVENTLTYANTFGDHKITAMAGQHADYYYYDEVNSTATGVPNVSPGSWYLGLGTGYGTTYDVDPNSATNPAYPLLSTVSSYFGRLSYSFKDRYLINATMRADGTSKFLGDQRWGYFPSVGAAWIVSQENFMKDQHIFNTLKLKGSWGKIGNVGSPTYASVQTTVSGGPYSVIYGNSGTISPGVSVASTVPPLSQWERSIGTDLGLEAVVLDNRLNIEADYYNKTTQAMNFQFLFQGTLGLNTPYIITNLGDARNRGVELALSWSDRINHDLSYRISGNIAINNNELVKNTAGTQKIYDGGTGATSGQYTTISTLGQPIGAFYGYKVIGIFQNQADINNYADKNGNMYQPKAQPGDFKYASTTGAGPISGNDRVILGNPNPKYVYGINTNWAYKQFDLSLDFNGVAGVSVYNANKGLRYGAENYTQDFYDHRWHGAGTSNSYPSANNGGNQNALPNSWYVESGSYFRIRNAQLGYTLSTVGLTRLGFQKLRVFINTQNPFTFFKYKGFTPEVGGTPGNAGIDTNIYPLSATYSLGVNVGF
jgi:TonB-linked SusC/RagA family outer membrane protein